MDDRFQASLFDDNAEYEAFTEKFRPKKTTDDCYTPGPVFEAVADWAAKEYGILREDIVRPFWPDSSFESFDYPEDCVVLDNPPFSLLSRIVRFYCRRGIRFFLFAPALTLFTAPECPVCYLATGADITYENGAKVPTSFVTNMDRFRLRTVPELRAAVMKASALAMRLRGGAAVQLPKYVYPDELLTAAAMQRLSKYGAALDVLPEDAAHTRALDAQREQGKSIFGCGFLLSTRATVERAAAERAAAKVWELSERERGIFMRKENPARFVCTPKLPTPRGYSG